MNGLTSVYTGVKTQSVMEKFRPILKKSLNGYINELMSDKIKSALDVNSDAQTEAETNTAATAEPVPEPEPENRVVTTPEELEAFFIVKMLLKGTVSLEDLSYKDTINYISILYQGKVTKWICRFSLTSGHKILAIPDENKKEVRYTLNSIYDIDQYKDKLVEVVNRYL